MANGAETGLLSDDDDLRRRSESTQHVVHLYEDDEQLAEVVGRFLADGLAAGDLALAICTAEHGAHFERALAERGVDVAAAVASSELVLLDADDTLAEVAPGGVPDTRRLNDLLTPLLQQAAAKGKHVSAFGEMVQLLWRAGAPNAALQLEELWERERHRHGLSLLCAYELGTVCQTPDAMHHVCHAHEQVILSDGARSFDVGAAREPTHALVGEIARRVEVERSLKSFIAALQHSEDKLWQSELQLEVMTDALPSVVCLLGADARCRFVNAAFERWFERTRSQTVGAPLADVVGERVLERLGPFLDQAMAGRAAHYETTLPCDGGERVVEGAFVPVRAASGEVTAVAGLLTDVSEKKRLEEARDASFDRTARLTKITSAIADAVTEQEVYEAIVDRTMEALEASSGALLQLDADGETVRLSRAVGWPERARVALAVSSVTPAGRVPGHDAIRERRPIWVDSQPELLERYPHLAAIVTPGRSYRVAALPIVVERGVLGALAFTFDDTPALDDNARGFLQVIARYAGQALERLRLLDSERKSRAVAETAAARMAALSRASGRFAEVEHSRADLLQAIVEDVTGVWADGAGVFLLNESGDALELAACQHTVPGAAPLIRALLAASPTKVSDEAGGSAEVVRTGVPLLVNDYKSAMPPSAMRPELRGWMDRYAPRALVVVPLRARERIVGTLVAVRQEGAAPFSDEDVSFFQDLADRAGIALENSALRDENEQARARAELLYALARAVIVAQGPEEVYDAAFEAIASALGSARASILTFDSGGVMRFRAWRGLSERYRVAVDGHSPWAPDARLPEPVLVPDVEQDPAWESYLPLFREEGVRALAFIPLLAGERLVGKFMVYYDAPRHLSGAELELASAIANHTAAAIARFSAVAELEQTVRFNEMFTGILGHDLRNPLSAITTAAELISRRAAGDERLERSVSRIRSSGERMARMIDQLLDFTRVRVGEGIPLSLRATDLGAVLREVIDELDDANPTCALLLQVAGDTNGDWDADRLSQVFSNLIANAVQHGVPEHGVTVAINGSAEAGVQVRVTNQGAVPAELLPSLFEPMCGGGWRRDRPHGLGLGLFISREIVRAHGGDIAVRSSELDGTTFEVSLPRFPSAAKETGSHAHPHR